MFDKKELKVGEVAQCLRLDCSKRNVSFEEMNEIMNDYYKLFGRYEIDYPARCLMFTWRPWNTLKNTRVISVGNNIKLTVGIPKINY